MVNRGKIKRGSVKGILIHTTGSGIVAKANTLKKDPNAYAAKYYETSSAYPHYLIDWNGTVYQYCDELKWAAHAKWTAKEKSLYHSIDWMTKIEKDGKLISCPPSTYQDWIDRWNRAKGLAYLTPKDILKQIGGILPNEAFLGIELLDKKPAFTDKQHESLAILVKEVCQRHKLVDTKFIEKDSLPQAWLCTHSDVSPIRRWAIGKKGAFAYDCKYDQLDWNRLIEVWRRDA